LSLHPATPEPDWDLSLPLSLLDYLHRLWGSERQEKEESLAAKNTQKVRLSGISGRILSSIPPGEIRTVSHIDPVHRQPHAQRRGHDCIATTNTVCCYLRILSIDLSKWWVRVGSAKPGAKQKINEVPDWSKRCKFVGNADDFLPKVLQSHIKYSILF
jgi:hypothetical protein